MEELLVLPASMPVTPRYGGPGSKHTSTAKKGRKRKLPPFSKRSTLELVADRCHRTVATSVVTQAECFTGRVLLNHADLVVAEGTLPGRTDH